MSLGTPPLLQLIEIAFFIALLPAVLAAGWEIAKRCFSVLSRVWAGRAFGPTPRGEIRRPRSGRITFIHHSEDCGLYRSYRPWEE